MTRWHSAEDAGKVAAELMSKPEAGAFMSTLDFKAYVMVQPIEGPDFDLATLAAQPGQVLEVAVRSVNEGQEQVFDQTRKAFVNLLSEQEGALESYEFEVVSENEDRLTVGMTVYESQEAFQTNRRVHHVGPNSNRLLRDFYASSLTIRGLNDQSVGKR